MIKDINYEPIIPGKGVGKIKLGMKYEQVIEILNNFYNVGYEEKEYPYDYLINTDNINIFLSKIKIVDGKSVPLSNEDIVVSGIGMINEFKGKLFGKIGIGSTLADVSKYVGEWMDDDFDDLYTLKDHPGVGFLLKDVENFDDEWNELTYPIESISVYPKDFKPGWIDVVVIREGKE